MPNAAPVPTTTIPAGEGPDDTASFDANKYRRLVFSNFYTLNFGIFPVPSGDFSFFLGTNLRPRKSYLGQDWNTALGYVADGLKRVKAEFGTAGIGAVAGACKAAHQDELACAAALTCEQLLDSLGDGGPCAPQHAAVIDACEGGGGGECLESSGQSSEGCDFSRICDGQPVLTMQCDDSSCTCLSGETKVGECAADGVCGEPDDLAAKAAACCAF